MANTVCSLCGTAYDPDKTDGACPRCGCFEQKEEPDMQKPAPAKKQGIPVSEWCEKQEKAARAAGGRKGRGPAIFFAVSVILTSVFILAGMAVNKIYKNKIENSGRQEISAETISAGDWAELENGTAITINGVARMLSFPEENSLAEKDRFVVVSVLQKVTDEDIMWQNEQIYITCFALLDNGSGIYQEDNRTSLATADRRFENTEIINLDWTVSPEEITEGELVFVLPEDTRSFTLCLDSTDRENGQVLGRKEFAVDVQGVAE